jgi:predicted type IV restriction endonuclease
MTSTRQPDQAFEDFERLQKVIASAAGTNEATTRLRAIDVLLFDILGWPKEQIEAEKYVRQEGYADYVLTCNGAPECVIEAKRDGVTFTLDDATYSSEPTTLALLTKESPSAAQALQQVIGYAASLGATYVGITIDLCMNNDVHSGRPA